jgi:hypothetical protein
LDKHLHVVSFAIPYPANYGGVIDVYWKLKWLHRLGVKVHLHCFRYGKREPAPELLEVCESVHYYRRSMNFRSLFSFSPFIVSSRRSEELAERLLEDDYPVLLEGLHCCALLGDPRLSSRRLIFRESNIEHVYYWHLFRAEKKFPAKLFFLAESVRLRWFEKQVRTADRILAVSLADTRYFSEQYPSVRTEFLPCFHPHEDMNILPGEGTYALYHGNLSVRENSEAAAFLIRNVFNDGMVPFVVAGLNPPESLKKLAASYPNISLVVNPPDHKLTALVQEAQVNVLFTSQATGLKLKLLNVLFNGRHCVANPKMLHGTGLEALCTVAETPRELKQAVKEAFSSPFQEEQAEKRRKLMKPYLNAEKAEKLLKLIYGE